MPERVGQEMCGRTSSDSSESRPVLWIETGVVLAWLAAPTLAWVACWLFWGSDYLQLNRQILHLEDRTSTTFAIGSMESLFSSLRLIPIVLFIMWRSGDKWSRFGLVKPKLAKDILIGMGLLLMIGVMKEMGRIIETPSYHWTWSRLFPAAVPPDRARATSCKHLCHRVFRGVDCTGIPHSAL